MEHPLVDTLIAYWSRLRGGRLTPYRADLEPREITAVLPHAFILEWRNEDDVRYRLAGTRLCEAFGAEMRGLNALALWRGPCRAKVRDLLSQVVHEPCVGRLAANVEDALGRAASMRHVYLPMRDYDGAITRILGCAVATNAQRMSYRPQDLIAQWVTNVRVEAIAPAEPGVAEQPLRAQPWSVVAAQLAARAPGAEPEWRHAPRTLSNAAEQPRLRLVAVNGEPAEKAE